MTIPAPTEQQLSAEIDAALVRDCLLLLHSPISPSECLRQAQLLLAGQDEARQVLRALDQAAVPSAVRPDHVDVRTKIRGNMLGAFNGVRDLSTRYAYVVDVKKNVAQYLEDLKGCDNDTRKMYAVTSKAVDARNELREAWQVKSASAMAKYQSDGWKGIKGFFNSAVGKSSEDKRSIGYLVRAASGKKPFHELTETEQQKVFNDIVEQSGKAGGLSTAWKTLKGGAATVQATVDLLLLIEETRYARDPVRVVAAKAVRMGAAVAVSYCTEAAIFTVVAGLGISTGIGTLIILGGTYFANKELNAWINETFLDIYDQLNPRISAVMRDISWEPQDFRMDMLGEPLAADMSTELKTSMFAPA